MRRVEKVVGEARSLRILRAARAQAPELLSPSVANDPEAWDRDCQVAGRIVADLAETPLPDGSIRPGPDGLVDRRRGPPLGVLDVTVLAPFVDAVQLAIEGVVAAMDPTRVVVAALEPQVLASIYPNGVPEGLLSGSGGASGPGSIEGSAMGVAMGATEGSPRPSRRSDPGRARRTAIEDASVLAWEVVLFEAVRRVHLGNDARRVFNRHADLSDLVVEGATVRRPSRLKAEAARKKAERVFARRVAAGLEAPRPPRRPKASPFEAARPLEDVQSAFEGAGPLEDVQPVGDLVEASS